MKDGERLKSESDFWRMPTRGSIRCWMEGRGRDSFFFELKYLFKVDYHELPCSPIIARQAKLSLLKIIWFRRRMWIAFCKTPAKGKPQQLIGVRRGGNHSCSSWSHPLQSGSSWAPLFYPTSPGKQSPNFSKQKFLLYAIHEIFFDQVEEERLITFLLLIPSAPLFLTIISWQ